MIRILLALTLLLGFNAILKAQADSAYVKIRTQTKTGFLVINDDYNNCIAFQESDSIRVPAKEIMLKVLSANFEDVELEVDLKPNETKKFGFYPKFLIDDSAKRSQSSYARCFWDANVIVLSDYDADIYFEDRLVGKQQVRLSLSDGDYETTSVTGNLSSRQKFNSSGNFQVIENFARPEKSTVYERSFFPGFAQFAKKENIKGASFLALSSALTVGSFFSTIRIAQKNSDYEELSVQYASARNPNRIVEIINESEQTLNEIDRQKKIRNYSLIGLGIVYALNIIDARRPPKAGFRSNKASINPYVDFDKDLIPKANLKIDF